MTAQSLRFDYTTFNTALDKEVNSKLWEAIRKD